MDEEMEDIVTEIDIDYEFDACMYFDLSRDESLIEAREAEMWFDTAQSYPPSPFVAKLVLREDILLENIKTSPKLEERNMTLLSGEFDDRHPVFSVVDVTNSDGEGIYGRTHTILTGGNLQRIMNPQLQLTTGLTFYNHVTKDNLKDKKKSSVKLFSSRSSSLMKPTASQLAKKNQLQLFGDARFQTSLVQSNEKSLSNSSGVESQAAKRQKLEGGQLRKVVGMKQQTSLVHKAPKKDGTVDGRNSTRSKLKLTIPREPELETAHRAHRIRLKNNSELEHLSSTTRFRACPLNRKILDAPSLPLPKKSTPRLPDFQVFHLKTLERAKQHSSAVSSSSFHYNDPDKGFHKPSTNLIEENRNKDFRRQTSMGAPKQDGCELMHTFKARPPNKKIFSSKGDIGVFRNTKRENTVPMESNFHTKQRIQQNAPIELFSKLSLTSQLQPSNGTQLKLPQPTHISLKGSKENRLGFSHQEHRMMHSVKDKPKFLAEQTQCGTSWGTTEICPQSGMSRGLGIR